MASIMGYNVYIILHQSICLTQGRIVNVYIYTIIWLKLYQTGNILLR